jgi:hypothetical protein
LFIHLAELLSEILLLGSELVDQSPASLQTKKLPEVAPRAPETLPNE